MPFKAVWNNPRGALEQAAQNLTEAGPVSQIVGGYKAAFPKDAVDVAIAQRRARIAGAQTVDITLAVTRRGFGPVPHHPTTCRPIPRVNRTNHFWPLPTLTAWPSVREEGSLAIITS